MEYRSVLTKKGLIAGSLVLLFALAVAVPSEAATFNLKTQLSKKGVSMKIVKLDRTDGFKFGLSFTGPQGNTFTLAPGLNKMFLVQAGDGEIVLQRDTAGKMQIIQASGNEDLAYVLCIAQAVITFLMDMIQCDSEPSCMFTAVIEVVTNVLNCNNAAVPTE